MALPPHLAELESRLASRFDEAIAEYRQALERRIRRDSDERLAAIAEVPAPAISDWLPTSQLDELDLAPKQEGARDAIARLADTLRRLDGARSQAEALDALLDGALPWADRVALILARDLGLTGWGDRGFEGESLAGRELDWNTTLRERLLASRGCLRLDSEVAGEVLSEFGVAAAGAAVVVPMVLRDRIAALVWADCRDGEPELAPLQILVHAAGQRLELQALTDRSFSPTLWEGAEAPGEPLPLWTVLTPAAVEESAAEGAAAMPPAAVSEPEGEPAAEPPEPESAAAPEPEPEPQPLVEPAPDLLAEAMSPAESTDAVVAIEGEAEEEAAELWEVEEAAPAVEEIVEPPAAAVIEEAPLEAPAGYAEPAGEVSPAEPVVEPQPEFELESVEQTAEQLAEAERWEPEIEAELEPEAAEPVGDEFEPAEPVAAAPETTAAPEPAAEPASTTEVPADIHGTVRMEIPVAEPPEAGVPEAEPPSPPEPTTPEPPPSTAGTQEVAAAADAEEEAPAGASDEDATVLSMRRPPIPEPEPAPAAEPPTWSASPPTPPAESPMERTGSRFARSTEVSPPPDVSGPGLAFLGGRPGRAVVDPVHEEAKRLARLLISEIRLYNEEQVLEGRRHRDLYHRLKEDIDRSRQIYDERVDAAVRNEVDYFQQELVRSLAGGDPRALGI